MATKRKPAVKEAARRPAPKRPAQRKPSSKTPAKGKPSVRKRASRGAIETLSGKALRLAGVGTDAVARATGKAWDQWLALLDRAGAIAMPHKAIASMLADKFGLPSWWSQMVAVGYEQARGLREIHQHGDGYAANVSRTVRAPLERLFGAWSDPKLRALWLGPAPIAVRRSTDGKSMRITWAAGDSNVDVNFSTAGDGRSRVQVEHGRLTDGKAREEQKTFWGDALNRLKAMLEKAA